MHAGWMGVVQGRSSSTAGVGGAREYTVGRQPGRLAGRPARHLGVEGGVVLGARHAQPHKVLQRVACMH